MSSSFLKRANLFQQSLKIISRDPKKLSKLYFSVAETSFDVGDFEKSARYYRLDLDVCSGLDPKLSIPSLLGLAKCAENSFADKLEIVETFLKAKKMAAKSVKMTHQVLTDLVRTFWKEKSGDNKVAEWS